MRLLLLPPMKLASFCGPGARRARAGGSASLDATVLWAQLVFLPSVMLGGLMVPTEMIPDALATLGRLLPATHALNAQRGLAFGESVYRACMKTFERRGAVGKASVGWRAVRCSADPWKLCSPREVECT